LRQQDSRIANLGLRKFSFFWLAPRLLKELAMKKQGLARDMLHGAEEYWPLRVDNRWQEQMVFKYAPLTRYIASRLALRLPSHVSLDDLISSGAIGLIDAIHKFDPGKNISFRSYAEFRIKGAILDELRSLDWIPRSVRKKSHLVEKTCARLQQELGRPPEPGEMAEALGLEMEKYHRIMDEVKAVSLVELDGGWKAANGGADFPEHEVPENLLYEDVRDPVLDLHFHRLQQVLKGSVEALADKDKLLLSLYYYEELTMKEIGEIMGYTESRISQLHTQLIQRLRESLQEDLKEEAGTPAGAPEPGSVGPGRPVPGKVTPISSKRKAA
jgi:RNA polymerase sigma factor for flagellar operon FliA